MTQKHSQAKEIIWNIVNSGLAAGLVIAGGLSSGNFDWHSICTAIIAGIGVALTKFSSYWAKEKKEYSTKLFSFIK